MANKLKVQETEQKNFATKVADFLVKNKLAVIISAAALVVVIVLVVVLTSVASSSKEKAMIRLDSLETRCLRLSSKDKADADYVQTANELIADLEKEIGKKGYVSTKATYLIGKVLYDCGSYSDAYDWFMKVYNDSPEVYLSGLSLLNAAVCKESLNDLNGALDAYKLAAEYDIVKPQALFNAGRIYYLQNNMALAKASFQSVVDLMGDSEYKALSQNILVTL